MTYIKEKGIKNLIIDLRTNGGGNSLLGDILLDYLTDKPFRQFGGGSIKFSKQAIEDRGYAGYEDMIGKLRRCSCDLKTPLENPLRFYGDVYVFTSRQTFSSATAFTSAIKDFHIGTIVGEETGGFASSYGDVIHFNLPNSGLKCGCSHKHFLRPSGEDTGRGVIPDYEVKPEPEDLVAGRDRVMEFTIKLINRGS